MSPPVAQGKLWEHLLREWADRLVVVMSADDLRRTEVQISRGSLGAHRPGLGLGAGAQPPRQRALRVRLGGMLVRRLGRLLLHQRRGKLFFDPLGIEGT